MRPINDNDDNGSDDSNTTASEVLHNYSSDDNYGNDSNDDDDDDGDDDEEEPNPSSMMMFLDPNEVQKFLVQEMNALSINEREKVYENIHGVSASIEEEPTFVAQCTYELIRALQKIQKKSAYNTALAQSPNYIQSLFLPFLRFTDFDPQKAASNMVSFLESKLDIFGIQLLGKHIGYNDLSPQDQQAVQSGWMQLFPYRDRSGRAVLCVNHQATKKGTPSDSMIRSLYYTMLSVADDVETQKRGIVVVTFGMESIDLSSKTYDFMWKNPGSSASLPVKIVGHHICMESSYIAPLFHMAVLVSGKEMRLHTRVHQGTVTETTYTLMTFGIPIDYAPITSNGEAQLKYFRQWLSRRIRLEQSRQEGKFTSKNNKKNDSILGGIELPHRNDILMGTGVAAQSYAGNIQFQLVIDKYKEKYKQCRQGEKKHIVEEVYKLLHSSEYSARFLERSSPDDFWQIASKDSALKKIAYRLRSKHQSLASGESSNSKNNSNDRNTNDNDNNCNNTEIGGLFLNQTGESSPSNNIFDCCRSGMKAAKRVKY